MIVVTSFLKTEITESRNELKKLNYTTKEGLNNNMKSVERIGKISSQSYLTNDDVKTLVTTLESDLGRVCFELVSQPRPTV